jgi:hypothetical protein
MVIRIEEKFTKFVYITLKLQLLFYNNNNNNNNNTYHFLYNLIYFKSNSTKFNSQHTTENNTLF